MDETNGDPSKSLNQSKDCKKKKNLKAKLKLKLSVNSIKRD